MSLAYDLLLPRLCRAGAGIVLADGNYVRRAGSVPSRLMAARLPGGSIGVHAAEADGTHSLCRLPLVSPTKANAAVVHAADGTKNGTPKQRASVASAVTCKFCAARLVAIGALTADNMSPAMPAASRDYALQYGSVTAADALAGIEARAAEAAAALASKPKRTRKPKASA